MVRKQEHGEQIRTGVAVLNTAVRDHGGGPLHKYGAMQSSTARFAEDDKQQLETLFASDIFNPKKVSALRDQTMLCPKPISDTRTQQLHRHSSIYLPLTLNYCPLAREVAVHRALFAEAVFLPPSSEGFLCYRFIQACLQPIFVWYFKLELAEGSMPSSNNFTVGQWVADQSADALWSWEYDASEYVFSDMFAGNDSDAIYVIMSSSFQGQCLVTSNAPHVSLKEILAAAEPARTKTDVADVDERKPKRPKQTPTSSTAWLEGLMQIGSGQLPSSSCTFASLECPADSSEDIDGSDIEELVVKCFDEMEHARLTFSTHTNIDKHFTTKLMGGSWHITKRGDGVYGCHAVLKRSSAIHSSAPLMCMLWKQRVFDLYSAWNLAGEPSVFPSSSCSPLEIPVEMSPVLSTLEGPARSRLEDILALVP
eukprot:6467623-Amphidinium_carterae.2